MDNHKQSTVLEVRITPPTQQTIDDWEIDQFTTLVVAQEGEPNGTPKLHYHMYLETPRSKSWIRDWVYRITKTNKDDKLNGNALYFTRKPHNNTHGYIVKSGNIIIRHGISQTTLDEWIQQSDEYVKKKDSTRKRKERQRTAELEEVFKEVRELAKLTTSDRSPRTIIQTTLQLCHQKQLRFPTRIQMEAHVLHTLYEYSEYTVRSYYEKAFTI